MERTMTVITILIHLLLLLLMPPLLLGVINKTKALFAGGLGDDPLVPDEPMGDAE